MADGRAVAEDAAEGLSVAGTGKAPAEDGAVDAARLAPAPLPAAGEPGAPADPRLGHLRSLPAVSRVLGLWLPPVPPGAAEAVRAALGACREAVRAGAPAPDAGAVLRQAADLLAARRRPGLRRVINATGIVLHTNLGRARLAEAAIEAMREAAGYCTLEMDLESGGRSARRGGDTEALLCRATGADAALVVNNGAAAALLAIAALGAGGEIIVSRGELVEIGGSFRIPDVIVQGGGRLREVGSTNRTRLADYRAAIGPETRLLLKVHPSNYRVTGFTEAAPLAELAALARETGVRLVHDIGSGALTALGEPTPRQSIAAGADLVTFSGDKLLGGPQAGLIAGTAAAVGLLRRHPLMRALRPDKVTLAALEATLRLHEEDPGAIPALRMLGQTEAQLRARADRLLALLGGDGKICASVGRAGGGTLPGVDFPSIAVVLAPRSADALARRLRLGGTPVIGRVAGGRLWLDMLAVCDDELPAMAEAVAQAAAALA